MNASYEVPPMASLAPPAGYNGNLPPRVRYRSRPAILSAAPSTDTFAPDLGSIPKFPSPAPPRGRSQGPKGEPVLDEYGRPKPNVVRCLRSSPAILDEGNSAIQDRTEFSPFVPQAGGDPENSHPSFGKAVLPVERSWPHGVNTKDSLRNVHPFATSTYPNNGLRSPSPDPVAPAVKNGAKARGKKKSEAASTTPECGTNAPTSTSTRPKIPLPQRRISASSSKASGSKMSAAALGPGCSDEAASSSTRPKKGLPKIRIPAPSRTGATFLVTPSSVTAGEQGAHHSTNLTAPLVAAASATVVPPSLSVYKTRSRDVRAPSRVIELPSVIAGRMKVRRDINAVDGKPGDAAA